MAMKMLTGDVFNHRLCYDGPAKWYKTTTYYKQCPKNHIQKEAEAILKVMMVPEFMDKEL